MKKNDASHSIVLNSYYFVVTFAVLFSHGPGSSIPDAHLQAHHRMRNAQTA